MSKLFVLLLVAACGSKSSPAPGELSPPVPPSEPGSAAPSPEPTGAICGTRGVPPCPENMFCSHAPGADCGEADKPGRCMVPPQMCDETFKPVCGCDGKTYSDACSAAAARVGIRREGKCD